MMFSEPGRSGRITMKFSAMVFSPDALAFRRDLESRYLFLGSVIAAH